MYAHWPATWQRQARLWRARTSKNLMSCLSQWAVPCSPCWSVLDFSMEWYARLLVKHGVCEHGIKSVSTVLSCTWYTHTNCATGLKFSTIVSVPHVFCSTRFFIYPMRVPGCLCGWLGQTFYGMKTPVGGVWAASVSSVCVCVLIRPPA